VTGSDATIVDAKPLAGGASRDTWFIRVQCDPGTDDATMHEYVMRRDLPTQMFEDALTREEEFRLMDAAYQSGVSVAKVRYLCTDESVLGSPFFIMDYVPGISIGRKVISSPELEQAREALPEQMAQELARIHAIDTDAHNLDFLRAPQAGRTPAEEIIAQTYQILDDLGVQNPVWEWALRYAQTHQPHTEKITFVHGDFRIGNLLVDASGLQAVIDWEFGHLGDPDEELGYLCMRDWRFGNGLKRAAGLTDRETFLQAYEKASGRQVNRDAVDWWELMGNIRWGVICLSQAERHLSGEEPSVELASLGRRSAEMQLETLRLIESFGGV
jgi:aminoglycoside phosphotransferase (APT) family kinase protein